ncbi:MAG: ABC transporter substrate-binding protein [Dehalococcoidia bacterium]|nr:ABC transporter substrate-binding protein [Dehalococcoidia bacterium]
MEENYWSRTLGSRVSRRGVIRGAALGGAGLAGAALIGCGGDDDPTATPAPSGTAGATATESGTPDPFGNIKRGGILKSHRTSDPSSINPFGSASFTTKGIAGYVYSRFYKIASRPDANPYSVGAEEDLAESAETEDGQHWVVKLRPGSKFHNKAPVSGREVTSDDVVASWEALTAEGSPSSTQVGEWTSLEAVDDYTINVNLAGPSGTFVTDLADTNKLFIMPREAFDGGFDPNTDMIGSGPWVLDSYQTSVMFKFSRNPDWYGDPWPFVDGIEDAIIPEYANSLAQFRAGNLHYAGITAEDVIELRGEDPDIQWRGLLPALLSFIYFSPAEQSPDAVWQDDRFRKAVSMMTDRDALTELGYNVRALQDAGLDVSIQWNNVIPAGWGDWSLDPQSPGQGESSQFFEFNQTEATALLEAAGYAGEEITYYFPNDIYGATFNRVAEAASNYLIEGGLNLSVRTQAYTAEYFPQTFAGNFNGIAFGYQTPFPEVGGYFNRMFGDDPNNHSRIHDPAITDLDLKQRVELDAEVRRGFIHDIQRINGENMYYVPSQAGAGTGWTGYRPEVRGISQTRGYGGATENGPNYWLDV